MLTNGHRKPYKNSYLLKNRGVLFCLFVDCLLKKNSIYQARNSCLYFFSASLVLVNIVLDAGTATGAAAAPVAVCNREKLSNMATLSQMTIHKSPSQMSSKAVVLSDQ